MTALHRQALRLATAGLAALGLASLGAGAAAQPLGLGPPPACQCSVPTPVPALSVTLVHCLCGGLACVVAQHALLGGAAPGSTQLQCVR